MLSNILSRNKRPRFNLKFTILELTNLPQLSGTCSVKWKVKDSGASHTSKRLSSTSSRDSPGESLFTNRADNRVSSILSDKSRANLNFNSSMFNTSFKGSTQRFQIDNHKVKFDLTQDIPGVKFDINKKIKDHFVQLDQKLLIIDLYSEAHGESDSPASSLSGASKQEIVHNNEKNTHLGQVKINLIDYIYKNFDVKTVRFNDGYEKFSIDKFLLSDSKINSIISIGVHLELIKGNYGDFVNHDFIQNGLYVPPSHQEKKEPETFQTLFSESSNTSARKVSQDSSDSSSVVSLRPRHVPAQASVNIGENSNINNVELITGLYYKTFQIPWDPRPGEYNPKQCVEDIFDGGNGWNRTIDGGNLIDLGYPEMDDESGPGKEAGDLTNTNTRQEVEKVGN